MKYYKKQGEVWAFESDGSQDHLITEEFTEMTQAEIEDHLTVDEYIDPKLVGVEFNGVMCSATKEDMWGLNAVKEWVVAGNTTNFEFDNGNTLELTPENYADFEAVWVPFRASFF